MSKILTDLFTISSFREILFCVDQEKLRLEHFKEVFHFIENLILSDKIYVDRKGIEKYGFEIVCEKFDEVISCLDSSGLYPDKSHTPSYNSWDRDKLLTERGIAYLEFARSNDMIFSPHPYRNKLINYKINQEIESVSKIIFSHIESSISESKSWQCAKINIQIPPIVEHVISFSRKNNLTLDDGINIIRNNKKAVLFRKYCTNIHNELKESNPRKRIAIYQSLFRDIDKLSNKWSDDLHENIKYKRRTLNLVKLFSIGKILETFGMEEFSIKDPILKIENPYLVFVHDIYNT